MNLHRPFHGAISRVTNVSIYDRLEIVSGIAAREAALTNCPLRCYRGSVLFCIPPKLYQGL